MQKSRAYGARLLTLRAYQTRATTTGVAAIAIQFPEAR